MQRTPVGLGLAVSGWVALAATTLPAADPLRVLVVTLFLVLCPGAAAVRLAAPAPDPRNRSAAVLETGVLTVALSLSIGALVAEGFFLSRSFSTARAVAVLAVLTTLMALLGLHGARFRRPRGAGRDPAGAERRKAPPRSGRARRVGPVAAAVALATTAAACGGRGAAVPSLATATSTATAATGTSGEATTAAPAPTTTSPAPAAPGPWHAVYTDDFNGSTLDPSRWTTCYDWNLGGCTNAGNREIEWYLPSQVAVSGGVLHLTATRRSTTGSNGTTYPWRSGMVSTGRDSWNATPRHTFTYGYFAARIQVPAGAGLFPAFWLMPETRATPPELDVVEFFDGTRTVVMTVHWKGPDGKGVHTGKHYHGPVDYAAGYHVFALDWEKSSLTWYVDGVPELVVTEHVPDVAMEALLTLAVGFPSAPAASLDSAVMKVDWVRIWQH